MRNSSFETYDLYLASAVSIFLDTQPNFKIQNSKVLFVFPISDDLYKAMSDYNNGVALNAYVYAQTIKRLRAEMLIRREMEGQNGSR